MSRAKSKEIPAEFIPVFARQMIDAGADLVVGHGPHLLRGMEIYKGKPIFYSPGQFHRPERAGAAMPADAYERFRAEPDDAGQVYKHRSDGDRKGFPADRRFWETVVPICEFTDGKLSASRSSGDAWPRAGAASARPPSPCRRQRGCRHPCTLRSPVGALRCAFEHGRRDGDIGGLTPLRSHDVAHDRRRPGTQRHCSSGWPCPRILRLHDLHLLSRFFPANDPLTVLLLAVSTLGIGVVARPLGARCSAPIATATAANRR